MNRNIYIALFVWYLAFTLTGNLPGYGQEPLVKSFDIRTESTRPKILKIISDSNGLIWTGTDGGIFIFDGISFTSIPLPDSLVSPVSCLFEDRKKTIWAGFENGKIVKIRGQKSEIFNPQEGIPRVPVTAFAEDRDGRLYFSTKGEGIYVIENKRIYNINHDDGLSDDYCYFMVLLPDQRVCAGTDGGLNFVSFANGKKTVTVLGSSEGLPDDITRTCTWDKGGLLWIGLQDRGLTKYDCVSKKLISVEPANKWSYGQINSLLVVADELWIATEQYGIVVMDRTGRTTRLKMGDNENIKANDLLLDFENNVWISESIHLFRTTGNKIQFMKSLGEKNFKFIHCIAGDRKGNMWFSPDQHLACLSRDKNHQWTYREYVIVKNNIDITALYFDPYGYLWIGTMGEGVFRFNPSTGKYKKIPSFRENDRPSILSINGTGDDIWVSGFNSVAKLKIGKNGASDEAVIVNQEVFTGSHLLNDYVYSVFIDSKKRIWFGSDENGVFRYDGNLLQNIFPSRKAIHNFTEDAGGRIWFTVAEEGLRYLDRNDSLHSFQTKDGLSDPSPTSLFCTTGGNIIVVHANGFDVLNPETKNIYYHSSEENLADINPDLNAVAYSTDSTWWLGTEKGIILYRPGSETQASQPRVVLGAVSIFQEGIDILTQKEFSASENNISFEFDGIWYSDPQKINYFFMLESYSNKWEKTKDHTITFPKLPPGTYTFRVKASLNSNYYNSPETKYTFTIRPPFWQTWWFRSLSAGLIALIILIIIRRREERIRKFDRLQTEKIEFQFETLRSQVNPHFLFNSFNTLISIIESTPALAVEYVERLSGFFRSIITYRDQNLINLEEELKLLDNYIFIQRKRYGDNLTLEIRLDPPTRRNSFVPPLTLQLLAENGIKHNAVSRETPLRITITENHGRLEISNNINPKRSRESSTGMGLQNIMNRYELLTPEKVEIIREENKFTVVIPLLTSKNENFNR